MRAQEFILSVVVGVRSITTMEFPLGERRIGWLATCFARAYIKYETARHKDGKHECGA